MSLLVAEDVSVDMVSSGSGSILHLPSITVRRAAKRPRKLTSGPKLAQEEAKSLLELIREFTKGIEGFKGCCILV